MNSKYLNICLFTLSTLVGYGQATDNSIFSRFGIGDITAPGYTSFANMGGSASGYFTDYTINNVNPASYSRLKTTAFDMGLSARYFQTDFSGSTGSKLWSGNLDNIALAFPLQNPINKSIDPLKKPTDFGMAFGINTTSRIGYNVTSTESLSDIGQVERNYQGFGGLYKFYWGSSVAYKGFSGGINLNYNFGKLSYVKYIVFSSLPQSYDNLFENTYNARGLGLDYGLLYTLTTNKSQLDKKDNTEPNVMTFGLHGTLASKLTTLADVSNILYQNYSEVNLVDTLQFATLQEGEMVLPASFGLGMSYQKGNKWALTGSFTTRSWSKYTNDANPEELSDVFGVQFGGWYTPDYKSYTSYFKRIQYKFGGFYNTEPSTISKDTGGEQVEHYGVSFGTQLPLVNQRRVSRADIGLTLGYKGNSVINERYLNLRFGFTFNDDQWFMKRKYN